MYSTGGGEKQLALIENLGAKGINYRTETVADYVAKHTDGAGFDVVFDSVGGENIATSFETAAPYGQIVTTVSLLEIDLSLAHLKALSLHVVLMLIPMLHNIKRQQHGEILTKLAAIVNAGKLKPIVDELRFGLAEVGQTHDRLSSGQGMGKVVIDI